MQSQPESASPLGSIPPSKIWRRPNLSRRPNLRRASNRLKAWLHSLPGTLTPRQPILRDFYIIGSIFTLPLAMSSTTWVRRGDPAAPWWAILLALVACALSLLCYACAICDLSLVPRRYSLAGTRKLAYEKLADLDPELGGIIESLRHGMIDNAQEVTPRDRQEMRIDFSYFLAMHATRTKRALLGVVVLSLLCIIMLFASVYIAIYSMEPEVSLGPSATAASRDGMGWILYGFECSLENVTNLGKHSESSPLAELSAIVESVTFFFFISVIFSVFLDLSREASELSPDELEKEMMMDLKSPRE